MPETAVKTKTDLEAMIQRIQNIHDVDMTDDRLYGAVNGLRYALGHTTFLDGWVREAEKRIKYRHSAGSSRCVCQVCERNRE